CLPMALGSMQQFRLVMSAVPLTGVVVDEDHRVPILDVTTELSPTADAAHAADLLVRKEKNWIGLNTLCQAAIVALEAALRTKAPADKPLQDRVVLLVGTGSSARTVAHGVRQRGGVLILASRHREAVQELAQSLECGSIPLEALDTAVYDILIVCDDEEEPS